MIYRLQKRLVFVSVMALLCVFILIYGAICIFSFSSLDRTMDTLTDTISLGGGKFQDTPDPKPPKLEEKGEEGKLWVPDFGYITQETPFNTRYFTVYYDSLGNVRDTDTEKIFSVGEEDAVSYADAALAKQRERGWQGEYRYKLFYSEDGVAVVFVDASMNRAMTYRFLLITGAVLLVTSMLTLVAVLFFSRRAVRPIAESYEKQKRFITDAGHELKTPLTLILTNLDIAQSQVGESEWIDDMREEGNRMARLIGELVALSRMDEEGSSMPCERFSLSDSLFDITSEFLPVAEAQGLSFEVGAEPTVAFFGNEEAIRRLISILLDNAVKYCDREGRIRVSLTQKRNITLEVENTYSDVERIELSSLFERFYRADKARTYTGGFGIGLSIAKAIVEKHGGEISAHAVENTGIVFRVTLPSKNKT